MPRYTRIASVLVGASLLAACGSSGEATQPTAVPEPTEAATAIPEPTKLPEPSAEPTPAAMNAQQIAEKLGAATVMIRADFPETAVSSEGQGSGTGIVLSDDGFILTNAHVVQGASAVTVATAGSTKERSARIIGVSTCDDLAVLQVDNTDGLEAAKLGNSKELKVGEEVVALGYPLGEVIGTDLSVTRGIISKKEVAIDHYESMIQTDAPTSPGNSGGPLVNQFGEVIGINTAGFDASVASDINFAISIDQAKRLLENLKEGNNYQWLGMNLVYNDYADYFGVEGGLVVAAVDSGSPASRIDVQPADLLTRLEGTSVNGLADVCKILRSHSDGDELKVELLRLTESESQLLQGELVIGDPKASADLDLKVVQAFPYEDSSAQTNTDNTSQTSSSSGDDDLLDITNYDFQSDTGEWYTGEGEGVSAAIQDGYYNITLTSPDSYFITPVEVYHAPDMAIGADVLPIGNARAGLALRYGESGDGKNYYTCWIDGVNQFGCFVSVNNQWKTLYEATPTNAIKAGEVNRIALTIFGDEITFSINDEDVAVFNDGSLGRGYAAVYLENFSDVAGASYDNITVVKPNE
jgi:S1-C subfamily serine protease